MLWIWPKLHKALLENIGKGWRLHQFWDFWRFIGDLQVLHEDTLTAGDEIVIQASLREQRWKAKPCSKKVVRTVVWCMTVVLCTHKFITAKQQEISKWSMPHIWQIPYGLVGYLCHMVHFMPCNSRMMKKHCDSKCKGCIDIESTHDWRTKVSTTSILVETPKVWSSKVHIVVPFRMLIVWFCCILQEQSILVLVPHHKVLDGAGCPQSANHT